MNTPELIKKVIEGDISALSKAITLIESSAEKHQFAATELLDAILAFSGNSIRIGITGTPGVGKSTFIEALGLLLCRKGHKVAVLSIDPSSSISKGSILGDKTRMELLSRETNAFIRPSPSSGNLGGVAKKTRESILICEAAGYNVIFIETVGVGQSEINVKSMTDIFLLLMQPGSGDELQGIKKGIVEITDFIVVNKCDGLSKEIAQKTLNDFNHALRITKKETDTFKKSIAVSSITGLGIDDVWNHCQRIINHKKENHSFDSLRENQQLEWFHEMIKNDLIQSFYKSNKVKAELTCLEASIAKNHKSIRKATNEILNLFFSDKN